jgi:hypothetical protein
MLQLSDLGRPAPGEAPTTPTGGYRNPVGNRASDPDQNNPMFDMLER